MKRLVLFVVIVMLLIGSFYYGDAQQDVAVARAPTGTSTVVLEFLGFLPVVMEGYPITLTPTNTPTNTPTAPPPYILSNHSWYVNSIGSLHVVGEVQNNTSNNLRFVRITANFFDSHGVLLDVDYTYTWLDNLPAGDKTCFDLFVSEPSGWAYYEFEAVSYWTDGDPLPNLTVLNDSGSYISYFGWYKIIGIVRNDHGTRVEYVNPVGTLYNASGTVIGCDFTYVNATHLDPSQQSSFEMTFIGRDYVDAASYRLQVDGNPQ